MIGNFILFQSLTYRGFLLKATTRGRLFSFSSVFSDFNSHAWPQKAKKGGKHSHAWSYRHAWPSSATRGTSATRGLTGTSLATRGPAWPRVAELGHRTCGFTSSTLERNVAATRGRYRRGLGLPQVYSHARSPHGLAAPEASSRLLAF